MKIIGLGNALIDISFGIESDEILNRIGIRKGAMDMISREKMLEIRSIFSEIKANKAPGGAACNSMRALANLGNNSGYIGKIGSDDIGDFYTEAMIAAGTTPFLVREEGETGSSTVLVSPDGERTMGTFLGPAPTLSPKDISDETLKSYDIIYIEGYLLVNEELVRTTMQRAKAIGLKVALDLANFNIVNAFRDLLNDLIPKYVDILFSNASEAEALTGLAPEAAATFLKDQVEIAIVTNGKHGIYTGSKDYVIHVIAEGGIPIDTTGSGDYFAAGFLFGLTNNASLQQSARIGSTLAGHIIDVVGTELSQDTWTKVKLEVNDILNTQ